MHRKRVTCELHDSYFRLMTIKHAIPKIEWAIDLSYNSVRSGSRRAGEQMSSRQGVVGKATTQQSGPSGPPIEFGDQLVRCWDENMSQRGWAPRPPVEHQENENDTRLCPEGLGRSICCSSVRSPKWAVYFLKKSLHVFRSATRGHTSPYLFIICLDYVLRTSIDKIRENGFELTKNEPTQALASMSMHTKLNICVTTKQATFPN